MKYLIAAVLAYLMPSFVYVDFAFWNWPHDARVGCWFTGVIACIAVFIYEKAPR